jgi:signal peptidase I
MRPLLTGARATVVLAFTVLTGLVLAALVPMALGCSAHVVISGSMAPRVDPGDVVVTHPVTPTELRTGQVVLVHDPQVAGGLLLHRLVSFDPDGRLVTRGDANQSDDSVHADPADVRGLAVLRIPWVGTPALWRTQARYGALASAAAVLVAAAVFASRAWGRVAGGGPAGAVHLNATPVPGPRPTRQAAQEPSPARGPQPGGIQVVPRSTAPVALSMTEVVRPATVHSFAHPAATTSRREQHSAPSTGRSLPPVPPAVRRPGHDRSAAARPAGRGVRPADDHGDCVDGGLLCGRPRR